MRRACAAAGCTTNKRWVSADAALRPRKMDGNTPAAPFTQHTTHKYDTGVMQKQARGRMNIGDIILQHGEGKQYKKRPVHKRSALGLQNTQQTTQEPCILALGSIHTLNQGRARPKPHQQPGQRPQAASAAAAAVGSRISDQQPGQQLLAASAAAVACSRVSDIACSHCLPQTMAVMMTPQQTAGTGHNHNHRVVAADTCQ